MHRLRRFISLNLSDKWILLECLILLIATRIGLHLIPYQKIRNLLDRWSRNNKPEPGPEEKRRIIEAIDIASRNLPKKSTCLINALVGNYLLRRRGYPVTLRIGVKYDDIGKLEAHAWLEDESQVILGDKTDLQDYVVLTPIKEQME